MAHNIPISFKIYSGDQLARRESLTQDIIKVGKLPSSHLRIEDENVSRMHAVIEVTSSTEVFIIDLGSASGTIVNGKKVNKAQLQSGDELMLGSTRVVVEIGVAEAAVAAPPPPAPRVPAPPVRAVAPAVPAPAVPAAAAVVAPPPPKPAAPAAPAMVAQAANPFAASAPVNPFGAAKKPLPNPFAPPPATSLTSRSLEGVDLSTIDPEKLTYGVVASGPPVDPNEVETSAEALEVMIMWGKSVMHVDHLSPARTFYLGEPEGKEEVDYLISPDIIGTQRMPIVVVTGNSAAMVFPQGAVGEVTIGTQSTAIESINLGACPSVPDAQQYLIPEGATVRVTWKGFTFMVRSVKAGKKVAAGFSFDWVPLAYVAGVMMFVGALLTTMYFYPPDVSGLNTDVIDPNSRLAQFIIEPPETEEPEQEEAPGEESGGTGTAHDGETGEMGDEESERTDNRYSIEGDANPEDQQMARDQAREAAATAGVVGALASLSGMFNAPTSPYGGDQAIGAGEMSALGALTGAQAGSNFGMGGLGLTGTGRGGGGFGQGTIGMGTIGTIGHGSGRGTGTGIGDGGALGDRQAARPQIRPGTAAIRGSLSADVIRRVVRRHLGEVRFCYEQALNSQPDLRGTVSVRWIISTTGSVTTSTVSGSTLGSARVESCIAGAVRRWTFPAPDGGGLVSVTYPFTLESN